MLLFTEVVLAVVTSNVVCNKNAVLTFSTISTAKKENHDQAPIPWDELSFIICRFKTKLSILYCIDNILSESIISA